MRNPLNTREMVLAGLAGTLALGMVTTLVRWSAEEVREHLKSKELHPVAKVAQLEQDVIELQGKLAAAEARAETAAQAKERRDGWDRNNALLREAVQQIGQRFDETLREIHGLKKRGAP